MKFINILRLFILAMLVVLVSFPALAAGNALNSLSQIVVDKPIDNSYRLSLHFTKKFKGKAFVQKVKNGSFFVYIPDSTIPSKNIKLIYVGNINKNDVKINIEEQPFIKGNGSSKYIKLSVDTPINSDIQLMAQTFINDKSKIGGGSFMSIYSIVILLLLSFAIALSISIFRAMKSLNSHHATYTAFPPEFLNSPKNYTKSYSKQFEEYSKNKKRMKVDSVTKTISPISAKDFSCFDLPDVNKETPVSISSAIVQPVTTPSLEERTIQAGITNPIEKSDDEIVEEELQIELDLPAAEPENQKSEQKSITTKDDDDSYSPELVSELRIAPNKGFYLTTIDDGSFALFGYIKEKVFFLQKFTDLTQVNLQARFYDRKNGNDLYIVKIDSYKVMLAVSDTEIKELAVI